MIKSQRDIYQLIESVLKESDRPMTCNDVWDASGPIRELEHDRGPNAISDYMGFMWRKGLLVRFPAPRTSTSLARYAYQWKTEETHKVVALPGAAKPLVARQNITITETKTGVVIELDNVSITVRTK